MATVYDDKFYDDQSDGSLEAARTVIPIVTSILKPKSVVDFGCGVGTWLLAFQESGLTDFLGIDGDYVSQQRLRISSDRFRAMDLTKPITLPRRYDLACALEVAEHLPEGAAEAFIDSLTRAADFVLFSAAIPRQGGTYHINEQWQDYWRAKFAARGYVAVDAIRPKIWGNSKVGFWYQQNIILYAKSGQALDSLNLGASFTTPSTLNVVHPQLFLRECFRDPTLGEMIKSGPRVLINSLRFHVRSLLSR